MYKKEIEQFLELRSKLNEFSRDFFDRYEMCIFFRRIAPLDPSIIDYVDNFLVDNDLPTALRAAQAEYFRDLIEEDREILEELLKLSKGNN